MPKKKNDFYIIYDSETEVPKPRHLRYLLIGMLVSGLLVGGLVLLSIAFGLVVVRPSSLLEPTLSPESTFESPGIGFTDWPTSLKVHAVESVALSPDGHTLAVLMIVDGDYALQLRDFDGDLSKSRLKAWTPVHTGVKRVRFSPDGRYLVLSGGTRIGWKRTEVRDATSGLLKFSLEGGEAAFSPDSRFLATTQWSSQTSVYIWELFESNITGARLLKTLRPPIKNVFEVAFSPDGTKLAATAYFSGISDPADKQLMVWNTSDWNAAPTTYPMLGDILAYMVFTPDSQQIIVTIRGGAQIVHLDENWVESRGIMDGIAEQITISPDGRWLALGFNGLYPSTRFGNVYGPISIWSIANLTESRIMVGGTRDFPQIQDIVFSPQGDYIISAHSNQTIIQWDYKTGIEVARLRL